MAEQKVPGVSTGRAVPKDVVQQVMDGMRNRGQTYAKAGRAAATKAGDTDEAALRAVSSLKSLTRHRRVAKRIAKNKDTITEMMSSVRRRPRFGRLVAYSLECFKNLAVDEVSAEEIVDEGGVAMMKDVARVNPYNEEIQRNMCGALSAMCKTDVLAKSTVDAFGTEAIVHSLRKHVDGETHVATSRCITALGRNPEALDVLVEGGTIEAMAAMCKAQADNPDALAAAAEALAKIAADPKHAERLLNSGAMEAILAGIKAHPENAALARFGVQFVANVAQNGGDAAVARLRDMGAVDIIVNALERHPDQAGVLDAGAQALGSLTDRADVDSAVGRVVEGNSAEDKARAMATVGSLALVEANVAHIVEQGGIPSLLSVVRAALDGEAKDSATNEQILESGCRALARLAVNENNIYTIMKEGGVKTFVSIVHGCIGNERVVTEALTALARMATRKENGAFIAKSKAVEAAIAAVKEHPNSARVARAAIDLIQQLCRHEETVPLVVAAGGIEACVGVINNHSHEPEILRSAINALGRMAISAENVRRLVEAGGLEMLVRILQNHGDDAAVAEQALLLLETAALVPANVVRLRELGALEAVMAVMELHPDNAAIQEVGARCMGALATREQVEAAVEAVRVHTKELKEASAGKVPDVVAKLGPAVATVANLALNEGNIAIMVDKGALGVLAEAFEAAEKLPASEDRAHLLAAIAKALARLAVGADPKKAHAALIESGALQRVLEAAARDPENEALAKAAMRLAEALASNEVSAGTLLKDGTLGRIIAVADAHPASATVLTTAARALGLLASLSDEAARAVMESHGAPVVVEAVVNTLDGGDESVRQLITSLGVLANLAVDPASAAALIEAGAIDAIMQAMRAHPDKPPVLVAAMRALGRLAQTAEIAALMGQRGVLQLVVRAMRDHPDHEELQETALKLIDALGMIPANAELLYDELEAGAIVAAARERFPGNAAIQECATRCLATAGAKDARKQAEQKVAEIDPQVLLTRLQDVSALDGDRLVQTLGEVQALMTLEDPAGAQAFIKGGGLDAMGNAALAHRERGEDVFKAAALAFTTLNERQEQVMQRGVLSGMEVPHMVEALCEILSPQDGYGDPKSEATVGACNLLGDLADKDANVQLLVKKGALPQLLRLLQSNDPLVVEAAARALAKISNNEEAAALLAQGATVRELIETMRKHRDKPDFLKYAVYLLGNLAVNEQLKTQIGALGGVQIVIECMERYPMHQQLIENCDYTLANLSYNNEMNMGLIVACNGVVHIVASMENHRAAEELLESATCALSNLCYRSDANKELIVKAGGARAIVDCVLCNYNNADLLVTGYRALGNLAYYAPNIRPIVEEGGVQGIVAGMTVHGQNLELVRTALGVLTNLASDQSEDLVAIISQEGAVQAIVEVVEIHGQSTAEVAVAALSCLCNLSMHEGNSAMVVLQGGAGHVVASLTKLDFESELQALGMRLLALLSRHQPNVERMVREGCGRLIGAALPREKASKATIVDGMRAAGQMALTEELAEQLGRDGALQGVLVSMQSWVNDPQMFPPFLACLTSLCRSKANALAMALPAMKACETSLSINFKNVHLVTAGAKFVGDVCGSSAAAAEEVTKTNLVASLSTCLRTHLDTLHTMHCCCRALGNMANASNEVKDYMERKGAPESLRKTQQMTQSDEARRAIQVVLDAIAKRLGGVARAGEGGVKSARALFGDLEDDEPEVKEEEEVVLEEDVRNFLTAGGLLMKHSNSAPPRPRHVFVTGDLKWLVWKDPKKPIKDIHDEETKKMKVFIIRSCEKGRCTPQLERKKWGKYLASEYGAFAVMGRERTVDLEAKTEVERDKWCRCIERWVAYKKALKKQAATFKM